ncbi:MAG: bifunctional tetrahydrofolate synthase/dihydrofolate synthase [Pseudomonadota bacterium]|nr:bifunctional tetrahydrofolate synthase/dihydrofolate synthase [Pseudomonadota bacterium]
MKNKMHFSTLNEWLDWQTALNPRTIELGLKRCQQVAQQLALFPLTFPVITVAGTNGKGSSVILLDAILTAAGYRVGRYMSPHIQHYSERISIGGQLASEAQLCAAFNAIETVRNNVLLTFFEFSTLAAIWLFKQHQVDIAVLEVGLGGRLDAVNVFDPTIALITAIGIDHSEWLGHDRESIGFEKAGILRPRCPGVCSDPSPPQRLLQHAQSLNTHLYCQGIDFNYQQTDAATWRWYSAHHQYTQLPLPRLSGAFQLQNAAGVLMVLTLLPLSLSITHLHQGLIQAHLPGRFQQLPGPIRQILDVAHNPLASQILAQQLDNQPCSGRTLAVVGALKDKDLPGLFAPLQSQVTQWYLAPLDTPRTASEAQLVNVLSALNCNQYLIYPSIAQAYSQAVIQAQKGDRIVIFGSFYTVAEVLAEYNRIKEISINSRL